MTRFRYVKRHGIWWEEDPEDIFIPRPMPKGFIPPKRRHVLAKLSIISAIAALGGLGLFKGTRSSKNNLPDPAPAPITHLVDGRVALPPDLMQPIPSNVLADAEAVLANNVSNRLFRSIQSVMPTNTSTNTLWLYTSALQKLSTDTNNVCHAVDMPQTNFVHFVRMAENIPTDQLTRVIEGTNTWFSFTPLITALSNPTNTFNFAQTAFEQSQRYQLFDSMTNSLSTYEGNTNFIYWDNATNALGQAFGHPTIGVGLNLEAHPDLLRQLHFKNSAFIQTIIHPNPAQRSRAEYIQLTVAELQALTRHVRANHHGERAANYESTYGLTINPNDQSILDNYFTNKTASTISKAEQSLQAHAPTNFADNSVMFGSYTNTVPLAAATVATDIAFNTGNDLNTQWPLFSDAYVARDFETAQEECHVRNEPSDRKRWKNSQMRTAVRERAAHLVATRTNSSQRN